METDRAFQAVNLRQPRTMRQPLKLLGPMRQAIVFPSSLEIAAEQHKRKHLVLIRIQFKVAASCSMRFRTCATHARPRHPPTGGRPRPDPTLPYLRSLPAASPGHGACRSSPAAPATDLAEARPQHRLLALSQATACLPLELVLCRGRTRQRLKRVTSPSARFGGRDRAAYIP